MRKFLVLAGLVCLAILSVSTLFSQTSSSLRFVSNTSPTCNGQSPCYATIQAAVNAAQAGDTIRLQAGQYNETVLVKGKNKVSAATEADRIVIEADPATPLGSVVIGTSGLTCTAGAVFQFASSHFVTLRGVTIQNASPEAVRLLGAHHHNTAIHLERNRIFSTGTCPGGIVIATGNVDTVLANNVIYGNGSNGVTFTPGQGGPHYVVGNTIHGNGQNGISLDQAQEVWLVNNVLTHNGVNPQAAAGTGFGVLRTPPDSQANPQLAVLFHNLLCGNGSGEVSGALLDSTDKGNLTPTGQEGDGVRTSPGCDDVARVYAALYGADGQPNNGDDDFTLATNSPAIDQGLDPRTLRLGAAIDALFTADFTGPDTRPQDGNGNGTAAFDMGALEKSASGNGGCTPGATQSCYTGPADTAGIGICQAGTQICGQDRAWGACVGEVLPGAEVCNGLDDNCNGQVDDNLGQTTCGVGACQRTVDTCRNGVPQTCTPGTPSQEICGNGIDDDCNGIIDDPAVCPVLPPDPVRVAPPIDPTVATTIDRSTAFLYTGANPIQTGVAPNTIESRRAAVIRGKVLDQDTQPLSGVTTTILGHPEFGQTLSRADGLFDMAVNGGGVLTITYSKAGYFTAQRQVNAPWQDFVMASDVVLLQADLQVSTVDLTSTALMQVARGSVQTDTDGTRQATLLIPSGTRATMVMPDGSMQPLTRLSVRATEFTVGSTGPQRMPAELPPTSGYTYAVVFTADEAKAAGAKDVVFATPLPFYVENFLNFPIGTVVPLGAYDAGKGQWVASDSGHVIKILSITNNVADVDTTGGGTADNGTALGITLAERQQLAALYQAGQALWRVLIPHFDQPWDANWGFGPPPDATPPNPPEPPQTDQPLNDPCSQEGSVIECQTQTLGESVEVTGTPFSLNYRSNRVPGRTAARTLIIPLSGAMVPSSLKRIDVQIWVAGQFTTLNFPPAPSQTTSFTWDGKDGYGRTLNGAQPATIRVGFVYDGVYEPTGRFGSTGSGSLPGGITGNKARQQLTLWGGTEIVRLGAWNERGSGLGGWALSVHHTYDPVGTALYLGTGERRSIDATLSPIITTVAGGYVLKSLELEGVDGRHF